MRFVEKLFERELDRLAPVLVSKAIAERSEKRSALMQFLHGEKIKYYLLAGGGCLLLLSIVGKVLESLRMRCAIRREVRRELEPMEQELDELKRENEALRKELKDLKN